MISQLAALVFTLPVLYAGALLAYDHFLDVTGDVEVVHSEQILAQERLSAASAATLPRRLPRHTTARADPRIAAYQAAGRVVYEEGPPRA